MDTLIDKIPSDISIKKNIVGIFGVLLVLALGGFNRQVLSLIVIIIAYLFYQKYFTSPRDLLNSIDNFMNTYFTLEEDKTFIQELRLGLPSIAKIEENKNQLFQYMDDIDKKLNSGELMMSNELDFSEKYMSESKKSIQELFSRYYQIANLLNDVEHLYPQQTMTTFLDTQREILREIHNFVFSTPGSKLPIQLEEIRKSLETNFKEINIIIIEKHNKKQPSDYNMYSSVLNEPHEPLAKNSFLDNKSPY
jgi:hypothetical protein